MPAQRTGPDVSPHEIIGRWWKTKPRPCLRPVFESFIWLLFTKYTRRKRCVQVDRGNRLTSHIEKPPQPISHSMTRLWGTRHLVHVSEISPWVILINQWFVVFFLELGTWAKRNDLGNPLSLGKNNQCSISACGSLDRWIWSEDATCGCKEDWGPPTSISGKAWRGFLHYDQPLKNKCTTKVNLSKFTMDVHKFFDYIWIFQWQQPLL